MSEVSSLPPAPEPPPHPGMPVDISRLLALLWRARKLLLLVAGVGVVLSIATVKVTLKPRYRAAGMLLWEPPAGSDAGSQRRKMRTLVNSIKLPRTLEGAQRREALEMSVDELVRSLAVHVLPDSNMLIVELTHTDARIAARGANGVLREFIEQQRQLLDRHVAQVVASARKVRDAARQELHGLRSTYAELRRQNGVLDLVVERQSAIEQHGALSAAAQTAQVELQALSERVRVLRAARKQLPETVVLSAKEAAPAELMLAKVKAELNQRGSVLAPEHPQVQALQAQVQALERDIGSELQPVIEERVRGRHPQRDAIEHQLVDATAERDATVERVRTYDALLETTRERLATLLRVEGQAAELLSLLELAQTRYAEAEAALARAEDIARTANTGLTLGSPAGIPRYPEPSKQRLLVAAAMPLALLAAVVAALLLLALRGLRAHSTREIAFWGGGPVVASASWPRDEQQRAIVELSADLDRPLAQSQGTTLVVPCSSAETTLAHMLVRSLCAPCRGSGEGSGGRDSSCARRLTLWSGSDGPELRRACRSAARVLVVVQAGRHSMPMLRTIKTRLGRQERVGFLVVGASARYVELPDVVGDMAAFWS